MSLTEDVKSCILSELSDAYVEVLDPMHDGTHLEAIVVSPSFVGLGLLAQQRLVMSTLKQSFSTTLHALKLKTYTPDAWSEKNKEVTS